VTKYGSKDLALLVVGGYDVCGVTGEIIDDAQKFTEDTTAFGVQWMQGAQTGLLKAHFSHKGWYDDAANSSNDALVSTSTGDRTLILGIQGNTIGKEATICAGALQTKYERALSIGKLHRANAEYVIDGRKDIGKILRALGADTGASGNTQGGNAVDNGASSAAGGIGALAVTALTLGGYTSVTFKIRHSTDNSTYADLITFTNVTTAPNDQNATVAGTVNRYLASSYLFNGAGAAQTVTNVMAFARR